MVEKVKKTSMNMAQQSAKQPRPAGAIQRLIRQLCDGRQIYAPRKQPDQVKQPEPEPRDGVVIARVPQVQKTQYLLVYEVEPQEAVIVSRTTAQREVEIWWVLQRCEDVPGRGNQQDDPEARERA